MTFTAMVSLLPLLFGLYSGWDVQVRTMIIEDRMVMRVPVRPQPPRIEWVEHKGPKCIHARSILGAFLSGEDQVDFVLKKHEIVRARLKDNCPALDFYEGFYLSSKDDRVCAARDTVRPRMGGSCEIQRFLELKPKVRR